MTTKHVGVMVGSKMALKGWYGKHEMLGSKERNKYRVGFMQFMWFTCPMRKWPSWGPVQLLVLMNWNLETPVVICQQMEMKITQTFQ